MLLYIYIYEKNNKITDGSPSTKATIKRNRSYKTYSALLTSWLDRLAHFSSNVSHFAGKQLATTVYLSRIPSAPSQADDGYNEENVVNNIIPHFKFVSKYGCLSNHFNQSYDSSMDSKPHNEVKSKPTQS